MNKVLLYFNCILIPLAQKVSESHKKNTKKNVTNEFSRTGEMNKLVHCPYVNPLESKQVRQSQAQLELHLHLVTTQDWL